MVLVDGDRFEDHNLNRQLLSTENDLGVLKVEAAARRVRALNSAIEVKACATQLNHENALDLVNGSDVVADCLDNISSRFILQTACRQAGIPFVSAAIAGLAGHVTTIFPQDPGLELIYGPPDALASDKGVEIELGCLPQAVLTIASLECEQICKVLLDQHDHLLRGRLLMLDIARNQYDILQLAPM
jgi:molybdopterin/thiamine biosynthesis adenylyltransferase